jgi:transposase
MPARAVLLFSDATILRWFPPLRYVWAFRGEQAKVKITGRNAKRVLFGTINPRTGHRVVLRRPRQRQEDFQAFLRYLRRRYRGRPIWLLLDKASCHQAAASQRLAARLGVILLWLPKQCPELNSQDHLWKELKRLIAANRQFRTIDEEADYAERWLLGLTSTEALRKAGVLSDDFWLKAFV